MVWGKLLLVLHLLYDIMLVEKSQLFASFLITLYTVNISHITFTSIVFISLRLTGICAAVYLAVMLRQAWSSGGA